MAAALPLEPDDPPAIGGYRLSGRLGEGGQGVVYLGEGAAGERVAVKVLKTADRAARARFAREMAAARRVAPFCTAAVLDSSADAPLPYVVSEFVDGPSLQQRVAERGPLRGGDLERLAVNTASALAAIHGAGIVHRDLKPANVLLGPDGPRVVDFGIARAIDAETHTQLVGTPSYFAPEWLAGHPPTAASDVFAWAGTMVFAATGRPPFGRADGLAAIMHRIAHEPPDLTGVPPSLHGLLATCLDKDPARRPTARDLMVRLVDPNGPDSHPAPPGGVMAGPPAPPPGGPAFPPPDGPGTNPSGPPREPSAPRKGRGALLGAGAVLAVALIAGGTWAITNALNGDTPPPNTVRTTGAPPPSGSSSPSPSQAGTTSSGTGAPAAFAGTWRGTVTQPPGLGSPSGSSSDVTITLRSDESGGEAVYKAWGCTDTLQITSASPTELNILETPKDSQGTAGFCIGGDITLKLVDGDTLSYRSEGFGSTTGTLEKSS
ncbi:serine/threonine-protein kinase [Actinomadura hibisca]|uniref:serine/threonine-protein kinase n=1 Tax=Actinomadura hibisca TaxID=68565 RepID=UPI00082D5184|nr:serine/threonine-protein kinase [Actinomadura hibisca]